MKIATLLTTAVLLSFLTTTSRAEDFSDLPLKEAQARKARLSEISYELSVNLPERGETFSGKSMIRFQLNDASTPLRMDFFGGQVQSLKINAQEVKPDTAKKKYWIDLPAAALKKGENQVEIAYSAEFSHESRGLHQFTDPQTKEVFLYSQFESYDANRFMPCFDQPDLRASLKLTVEAPAKWQVISTTNETSSKTLNGGTRKLWSFPESPRLATYLFSLHAGPFKVWTDQTVDKIPLRLFARPSLAKYVPVQDWFRWTKSGLKFFGDYFAFKYPFKKYDQVLVPEFEGAMENVAAVTYSEQLVPRSKFTRRAQRPLVETLLHEMAHMWFGNIVTMSWWNDLWLNESFASFMSAVAMLEVTELKESWQYFFMEFKNWAYYEDELVTTHPIEAPVNSVKESNTIFDGVTYGKGASVLKQLWAYVTPEKFQQGLQDYIRTYAFKNADLSQFIVKVQAHTDHNLKEWSERWLKQSGTDWLTSKWKCEDGKLKHLEITSTPEIKANFRPQGLQIALFTDAAKKPVVVNASLTKPTTAIEGEWECPKFVYPNYQDGGYAQVDLDLTSLGFVKENLANLQDPLLRQQLWSNLWHMLRAERLTLGSYVQIVQAQFPSERDEMTLEQITRTLTGDRTARLTVLTYWPPADQVARRKFIEFLEGQLLKRLQTSKSGSDEQKFWFDALAQAAQSPAVLTELAGWSKKIGDLDREWSAARQLMRYQRPEGPMLVERLKRLDTSDRGKMGADAADAIQPIADVKAKWMNRLKAQKLSMSSAQAQNVASHLFPPEQMDLALRFATEFYSYLINNGRAENEGLVSSIAQGTVPLGCQPTPAKRLSRFLNEHKNSFSPSVDKILRVELQEDERCQKIRKRTAS